MKTKYMFPLIFSILLLLHGCGGGGSTTASTAAFSLQEKRFVHNLFLTEYLWYDQVTSNVDYAAYTKPQEMIDVLRVDPPDRWSFMLTQQEYAAISDQKTEGFGFGYTKGFRVYLVRIGSPAWGKLQRGDEILSVNGEAVNDANIHAASKNLNTESTFTVLRGGSSMKIVMTPEAYHYRVTLGKVIEHHNKKIGYMRFDAFTESAVAEIEETFTMFHKAQIDELVIDLRYNGGGSVDTASVLLDNITDRYPGKIQMYLDWNANYQNRNSDYTFENIDMQDGNELDMTRVFFLVTKNSASASEALINALIPYLGESDVITIGTATHGKPVGMSGRVYGKDYYFLINFTVKNSAGNTTSFDGIPVTCTAEDDLTHRRGDENETMFKTAIAYMQTGDCP